MIAMSSAEIGILINKPVSNEENRVTIELHMSTDDVARIAQLANEVKGADTIEETALMGLSLLLAARDKVIFLFSPNKSDPGISIDLWGIT